MDSIGSTCTIPPRRVADRDGGVERVHVAETARGSCSSGAARAAAVA